MIVEMGDYAWSEHIVAVFLASQITIKNVQVQRTVKGKTTPDSYTPAVLNGRCRARLDMSRPLSASFCEVYLHVDGQ
jgi:hypothetical protein